MNKPKYDLVSKYQLLLQLSSMDNITIKTYIYYYKALLSIIVSEYFTKKDVYNLTLNLKYANVLVITEKEKEAYNQIQKILDVLLKPTKKRGRN